MERIRRADLTNKRRRQSFIIAEAGVNHNGKKTLAKKLVDAAVDAGVDAVKFQTFMAELIVTEKADLAKYQKGRTESKSQQDMLRELELNEGDFAELKDYCDSKRITFLSTPHSDKWSVDVLYDLVDAYKVGSGDLTNIPILEYIASKDKPIILSTGMATMEEIVEAIDSIGAVRDIPISVLHCTTMYPCPPHKVNLRAMESLANLGYPVGFSDHTEGIEAPVIAACLGATIIEKHFTLDRGLPGPDHKASLEPSVLKKMVQAIRYIEGKSITDPYEAFKSLNADLGFSLNEDLVETILGSAEKKPCLEELDVARVARKSIIARQHINKGDVLSSSNLCVRRPGEGIAPKHLPQFIGKRAKVGIRRNAYIAWSSIE